MSAVAVLKRGPDCDVVRVATLAREKGSARTRAVPVLALHGAQDDVVSPMHATEIVREFLAFAGYPAVAAAPSALPPAQREEVIAVPGARRMSISDWRHDSHLSARLIVVDGLGHAWSGGDESVKFSDPHPPDATALLRQFMADVLR